MAIWEADEDLADLNSNYRDYYEKLLLPVLQKFLASSQRSIYIILDGLNELPKHRIREALSLISAIQTVSNVRVILTSQPTKAINKALQTAIQLSLSSNDNLDNVEAFVKCSLNDTLTALFNEIGVDPIKYFREKCLGMFLWVKAILELIARIDVTTDLQDILDNPPRSIRELYQKVLERLYHDLNEIELPWIQEIITWTVMSKRDLTLAEIEVAILLSRQSYTKSAKPRVINIENTLNKCATILRIIDTPSTKVKTISLIHDSFKHFITNPDASGPTNHSRHFLVLKSDADCRLATSCISYLCNETIEIENVAIIPDLRRKRLNTQLPMFNYASTYWAKHLVAKGPRTQKIVFHTISRFLQRENLRNWISSVMAYTYNAYQGALYDPLSLSVPASINDLASWIVRSDITEEIIDSLSKSNPSLHTRIIASESILTPAIFLKRWSAAIIAEVWMSSDPKHWEISVRCFDIARNLCLSKEEIVARKLPFENVVRMVDALAPDSCRTNQYKWLVNESNVYLRNGRLESQASADSVLRLALETATETEKAVVLSRLSNCFTNMYYYTNSMEDLNNSVSYAERVLSTPDIYRDYDYFYYLEQVSRPLFLRAKKTLQSRSESSKHDWQNAVKFGMQALRRALTYDTEPDSPTAQRPENNDWNSLPPPDSVDAMLHPAVFDILNTLSFGLSIQPTDSTRVEDLRGLIDTCRNTLTTMTEHNPAFWCTLGHALFSCHNAALRSKIAETPTTEGLLSGNNSKPNSNIDQTDTVENLSHLDLQEAIDCYRKAISLITEDHPDFPMYTANLAIALVEAHVTPHHLDEAVDCLQKAVDMTAEGQMELFEYLYRLGLTLRQRDESISDTVKAMACYRKVINLAPKRHVCLPFAAFQLGMILESVGNLTEAIACYHFAIEHLPANSSEFPSFLNRLGNTYYKRANPPDDYTSALDYFQQAASAVPKKDKEYPIYVANAADALSSRAHDGDVAMAIEKYREALHFLPDDHENVPRYENSLSVVLHRRSLHGDLDASIEHSRKALEHPAGVSKHHQYYTTLGLALQKRRYPGDLDQSVHSFRRVLELCSQTGEESNTYENNLGSALYNRGTEADIREAISHYLSAMEIAMRTGLSSSTIAVYAYNIGNSYARYEHNELDLENAVMWYEKAVDLECKDLESLALYIGALGSALDCVGRGVEAIGLLRIAIAWGSEDHPQQPVRYQLLAESMCSDVTEFDSIDLSWIPEELKSFEWRLSVPLKQFFGKPRSIEAANESVAIIKRAIELSLKLNNLEQMAHSLGVMSVCLMQRYTITEYIGDLEEANMALRSIFTSEWRKDLDSRVFDLMRFGTVCIMLYYVMKSPSMDDVKVFVKMAEEVGQDVKEGSESKLVEFNKSLQYMRLLSLRII